MKNDLSVSFCVWEFNGKSHDEISEVLGIKPTKKFTKGLPIEPKRVSIARFDGWFYEADTNRKLPFEQQINILLDIIEENMDGFKSICSQHKCEISLGLYLYSNIDESTPSIHLTKRYHQVISQLDIALDMDIILLGDYDEEDDLTNSE
jgi:hypothetical protein